MLICLFVLFKKGAIVILACRDIAKAYKASTKILLATRNENVFADKLDLADLKSISSFAERFKNRFNRLDILINNAGSNYFNIGVQLIKNKIILKSNL